MVPLPSNAIKSRKLNTACQSSIISKILSSLNDDQAFELEVKEVVELCNGNLCNASRRRRRTDFSLPRSVYVHLV